MTLGIWLLVVGTCDLLRAARDATSLRLRALLALIGCALLVVAGVGIGFSATWWLTVGVVWAGSLVAWVVASSAALDPASARRGAWRVAAFAAFLVPVLVLGFLAGSAPRLPAVPEAWRSTVLGEVGLTRTVLLAGVLVLELSTGNLLVRLFLDAVGVPAARNEASLRGGRLLGPMERVFIVTLALGGELTAAAVVVAAKGLLRWPELRSAQAQGPTPVSEYFLVGSFASWLLGVLGWALTRMG